MQLKHDRKTSHRRKWVMSQGCPSCLFACLPCISSCRAILCAAKAHFSLLHPQSWRLNQQGAISQSSKQAHGAANQSKKSCRGNLTAGFFLFKKNNSLKSLEKANSSCGHHKHQQLLSYTQNCRCLTHYIPPLPGLVLQQDRHCKHSPEWKQRIYC